MAIVKTSRSVGRPTGYDASMPKKLIVAMGEGLSIVRFCAQEGIAKSTFYEWAEKNPEFSVAFDEGKMLCEAFWEKWLVENFKESKVNAILIKMFFANRFGWHDKKEVIGDLTVRQEDAIEHLK